MRRPGVLAAILSTSVALICAPASPRQSLYAQQPNAPALSADTPKPVAPTAIAVGRFDKVAGLLRQHVDRKQIAGAVALVLHQGKPIFSAAIGSADTGSGENRTVRPMADDTIFRIASMTKPVTSVAVLMLAEEGRFELTDPLSKYLPEFKAMGVLDPSGNGLVPATRQITIHDLLTHTSGLTYGFFAGDRLAPLYRDAKICDGLAPADCPLADNVRRLAALPLANRALAEDIACRPTCLADWSKSSPASRSTSFSASES